MMDLKSSENPKCNLIHYLAEFIKDNFQHLVDFPSRMMNVYPASREKINFIQMDVTDCKTGLRKVDNFLSASNQDPGDPIYPMLTEFQKNASKYISKLESNLEKTKTKIDKLLEYLCEDSKTESDAVFDIIHRFLTAFEKAKDDNLRRKQLEEKQKKQSERATQNNTNDNKMDSLLSQLATGEAYSKNAVDARSRKAEQRKSSPMKRNMPKLPALKLNAT
eukprot:TRINITY_DN1060_c0_g1_i1.p1 TRINITY_DN1060_c0_g1~~TRINITY_DN1060_c0_g1_i1.p1  ORF type:complete len:220 (-),score=47.64 TRINITY_DN1060_c0_g1_i1:549-1208(-)